MTKSGRKRPGRKVVRVKFGSAHVPIYVTGTITAFGVGEPA